ncbi:MAG: 2Fe-2S iron-sulfur cluster-binding protein [Nonlabens sp.]|nr:2Fe-2S iron-sulfur cluster-binding protein [Nonlabens sp.]MDP5101933.1 2Fe-2S iron-sulfur cluster-binding protein [Nonlabens sp.]
MSDITVHIIDRKGVKHTVEAPTDMAMNIMELCKVYELPVEAVCGGMAMCATCQCYIISDHNLGGRSDDEQAMLWEAQNVKENSRLGCQLVISESMDGLIIELAPEV